MVVLREPRGACANLFELRVRKSESSTISRGEMVLSQPLKLPEGLPALWLCLALASFQPNLPHHALASLTWPCPRAFAPAIPSVQNASIMSTLPQGLICEALAADPRVTDKCFSHEATHHQLSESPNCACEAGSVLLGSFLERLGMS